MSLNISKPNLTSASSNACWAINVKHCCHGVAFWRITRVEEDSMNIQSIDNPNPKKFVSYNVNGIRAAINRGFMQWLVAVDPDVIGLQEVKCIDNQLDMNIFTDLGYHVYWHPAVKRGYCGVAILSKIKPNQVIYGVGLTHYDDEGRLLHADLDGISFLSACFTYGTSGSLHIQFHYQFLTDFIGSAY